MTKILLADDVKLYLALEKTFLARGAYEILTATNGPDALGLLRSERPSLCIVATGLPGLGAFEIRDLLLADPDLSKLPMIVTIGAEELDGDSDLERRAAERGIAAVLVKPFSMNVLMGAVQKVLPAPARRHPRYDLYVEVEVRTERSPAFVSGAAHNVSIGGMLVEMEEPLSVGQTLWLQFFLGEQPEPIVTRAAVVRFAKEQRRVGPCYGLEFAGMAVPQREQLERYIAARHGAAPPQS